VIKLRQPAYTMRDQQCFTDFTIGAQIKSIKQKVLKNEIKKLRNHRFTPVSFKVFARRFRWQLSYVVWYQKVE